MNYKFPPIRKLLHNADLRIISTGSYLPNKIVSNDDIINQHKLNATNKIILKTMGTNYRRKAEIGQTDSELLYYAALNCLNKIGFSKDQLSKLIVTKFLGDRILPMTASLVQKKLGSNFAFHAIDIDGGLNSFLNSFILASKYISTTDDYDQYILILSGGVNSLTTNPKNLRTAFLFGDGAGAVLLKSDKGKHLLASYEFTNWQFYDWAGSRNLKFNSDVSNELFEKQNFNLLYDLYILDNWKNIKDFYIQSIKFTVNALLEQSFQSFDSIDYFFINEFNLKMYELLIDALNIPNSKTFSTIENLGNTMSAIIPIKLDIAFTKNLIQEGMKIMILSFGEGVSGGGFIYQV